MAEAIPEGTIILILIVAIIILAILWNDSISASSSSSSGSSGGGEGDEEGGRNGGQDPSVTVREEVNHENGSFRLMASAEAYGGADIAKTGFIKISHYPTGNTLVNASSPEQSGYIQRGSTFEVEESGIAPGAIRYTAWTQDSEGNTATYNDDFKIEPVDGRQAGGLDIDIEYEDDSVVDEPAESTFGFLDDFRVFRHFMQERESKSMDMGPFSASSAFCEAYYAGNISLEHDPVTVIEKISQLANMYVGGQSIDELIGQSLSSSQISNVESTINLYRSIESGSRL